MTGTLYGIGVGPGDPELLTFKAARLIRQCPVVAYIANQQGASQARVIAQEHLIDQLELPIYMPFERQRDAALSVYDQAAADIAHRLEHGQDVAVLCEGDPLLFGSFIYLHDRLGERFPCQIVPGISSIMAAAAAARHPLTRLEQSLRILPATAGPERLASALHEPGPLVIMKPGRQYGEILRLLRRTGRDADSVYVEYASRDTQRIIRCHEAMPDGEQGPYFALFLIGAQPC
ncbi:MULTISPECIES: precorrin-2 C(20)-methyltransferase [Pseudomonas]|uniref:Precorrin-2 C(20)-methyltransferase n=1 Tax=Pseudomonas luteola TaxID=47886 RepID=A0A2X2EGY2_PSELU|nr:MULTISPECIES: precorrin-2 C(20)-methyltransferase [Pseudomonas]ENA29627.1 precorrin-2 C20-methyltransferase [Pseudomonas sp. HPB0071]MBA1247797.1 precorrin-2 C(20)-methyltransferase [Pseudomonas zeshuii]MBF8640603.1 precorrin-2 C(20)-methyltransferase [Pseudomonas zeshuii]MBH3437211.1 precorrin-2 C(20)-methyltransferase [Pseudomonas luteola]SHI73256.1 precorrin-2/cobalt-factor-2 C20-methyltransferase [Pseudomonas zeshuii]